MSAGYKTDNATTPAGIRRSVAEDANDNGRDAYAAAADRAIVNSERRTVMLHALSSFGAGESTLPRSMYTIQFNVCTERPQSNVARAERDRTNALAAQGAGPFMFGGHA